MIVTNLDINRGRKISCIFVVAAACLFAWYLVANDIKQKWPITRLAADELSRNRLYANVTKMRHSTNWDGRSQPENLPRKVLIISSGRSGSSFLGDLFNQNKEILYLFEPLAWCRAHPRNFDSKTFQILHDLYNCKFTMRIYLNFLLKHKSFRRKSNKLVNFPAQCPRLSRSSQECLSKILTSSCVGASSLVVKVLMHRLPQGGLWGIRNILDANKNLRIVHLLRDPRRVIASMRKVGWFEGKNFTFRVALICSYIWENVEHVLNDSAYYKGRYKLLVFSDMLVNPFLTVTELYKFLKMGPVPEYIFSWIQQNTVVSKKSMYATSRNSTEVLTRKVHFTTFEEQVIDKHCSNITRFIDMVRKNKMI